MKVVVIAARKGGSGKTTLAGHLAVQAERAGQGPAALIDIDPQGSLSAWWNGRAAPTPVFAQTTSERLAGDVARLRDLGIATLFIDTPPALSESISDVVKLADLVVIRTRPSPHDLRSIGARVRPRAGIDAQRRVWARNRWPGGKRRNGGPAGSGLCLRLRRRRRFPGRFRLRFPYWRTGGANRGFRRIRGRRRQVARAVPPGQKIERQQARRRRRAGPDQRDDLRQGLGNRGQNRIRGRIGRRADRCSASLAREQGRGGTGLGFVHAVPSRPAPAMARPGAPAGRRGRLDLLAGPREFGQLHDRAPVDHAGGEVDAVVQDHRRQHAVLRQNATCLSVTLRLWGCMFSICSA